MASPQVENGYTKIANELLEAIAKTKLSSLQLRILLLVLRYTYGFGRKEADLSLAFISEALKAKPNNISRELSFLKSSGIVYIDPARGIKPQRISINKDYESWNLGLSKLSIIKIDNIIKNDNTTIIKNDNTTIIKIDNQERKLKKNNKKIYICAFFEKLWEMYPRKKGKNLITKEAMREIEKIGYDRMSNAIEKYKAEIAKNKIEEKFIKYGSSFFNGGYEDYLTEEKPKEVNDRWRDYQ